MNNESKMSKKNLTYGYRIFFDVATFLFAIFFINSKLRVVNVVYCSDDKMQEVGMETTI